MKQWIGIVVLLIGCLAGSPASATPVRWDVMSGGTAPSTGAFGATAPTDRGALGVAGDADHLYIVGVDEVAGDIQWRIEKRRKQTGVLVNEFGSGGVVNSNPSSNTDVAYVATLDGGALYVGGCSHSDLGYQQWRIEKLDASTGALIGAFNGTGFIGGQTSGIVNNGACVEAIQVYGDDLYVAGFDHPDPSHYSWRIERRDKTSGALVPEFNGSGVLNVDVGGTYQYLWSLQVDSNAIYLGGSDGGDGSCNLSHDWRIEKRDRLTGASVAAFGSGGVVRTTACTGPYGYGEAVYGLKLDAGVLYAVGPDGQTGEPGVPGEPSAPQWRIEKRDAVDGSLVAVFGSAGTLLVNPSTGADVPYALDADATNIYIVGREAGPSAGDFAWRIEARDKASGALDGTFGIGGVLQLDPSSGEDAAQAVLVDSSQIYVAGSDSTNSNTEWRIMDLGPTDTPTATQTPTSTPTPVCPATPLPGCRAPGRTSLRIRNHADDSRDKLSWKWTQGGETLMSALGDPRSTTNYALCIYDSGATPLVAAAAIAGGSSCGGVPCWIISGSTGFRYLDRLASHDGMLRLKLRSGAAGSAVVKVVGRGLALPDPVLPLTMPVTAQIRNSLGECWSSDFTAIPIRNDAELFKAKGP